jgi:hypothetical protein
VFESMPGRHRPKKTGDALMKFYAALLAVALVGACATRGPSIAEIQRDCGAGTRPFVEEWPCERDRLASGEYQRLPSDLVAYYTATGNGAYESVRAGRMTDAEARSAMSKARSVAQTTMTERIQHGTGISTVYDRVGPGPIYRPN